MAHSPVQIQIPLLLALLLFVCALIRTPLTLERFLPNALPLRRCVAVLAQLQSGLSTLSLELLRGGMRVLRVLFFPPLDGFLCFIAKTGEVVYWPRAMGDAH